MYFHHAMGLFALQLYPVKDGIDSLLCSRRPVVYIEEARCGLQSDEDLVVQTIKDAPGGFAGVEGDINVSLKLPDADL